ncbi:MAG TPA: TIM barrel protein [Stackebrandtia sp.]|uniref:sugar phosphate isomerase/epimerase and 4-hydroxyphenylpyruvate domain-containing protein n=1 Tax=Stackebrandtia sp. TaxID=2023065 RepID=UPI002D58473F|nr:TIM barrel protein [Stackebrandtia sp.]HZE38782.1 TIM barrel protein [Stackebrandtia sp.]
MSDTGTRRPRGIATVCLSGTIEDKLDAAARAGFDGVEIFEDDLIATSWAPERIRQRCADLGLNIDLYQPFRDFEAAPPRRLAANLRRAEHKFDLMERLGVVTMLVCSSVAPDTIDDDDLAAAQLRQLAEHAARRGLRVAYEALAWGRHVNTYTRSADIVARADHPALGLCLDSFHILSRGSDPGDIADIPGDKLFFLQLADAPRPRMDLLQWSRHHRLFPGQGDFDLSGFLRRVLAAGYQGPLSLEVFNDVFRQAEPHRAAIDAMRSLLTLEESIGAPLPEAPAPSEVAFTSLTPGENCRPELAQTLAAMGFALTGRHRRQPVELWEQGTMRVLLDDGSDDPHDRISGLAVETTDPAAAARRAEALLAPVSSPEATAAAPLSVRAPDGSRVIFCDADWRRDFHLTAPAPPSRTHLLGVDHIALTQPFDHFDAATLFYHSILGLNTEDDGEYAAPFGLVRSRALSDPRHRVRIALSVALLRRGAEWSPGVPAPQHIAFATDDIFAAAEAMRANAVPLLSIPDNYYDDLGARLAPPQLDRLRAHHVLYDRDRRGEFLHLYTAVHGNRVFFEVVQRIGDYSGYGTANAPVRMAAHRRYRLSRTPGPGSPGSAR